MNELEFFTFVIMTTYAIVGASGLIGGQILHELLQNTDASIKIVSRRSLGLKDPRLSEIVVEFSKQDQIDQVLKGCDAVFVTVGTTQKQVKGDRAAYRKVDHDIPISVAAACVSNNIRKFLVVSSVGANSKSNNFYLRTKGEMEDAVTKMAIPYIGIFQPSLLLGNRKLVRRSEKFGKFILSLVAPILPKKYRPIAATDVAKAMLRAAAYDQKGVIRYTYAAMVE